MNRNLRHILFFIVLLNIGCKTKLPLQEKQIDLESHIQLSSDTLLLGEPFYAKFILQNKSNDSLFIEEGGDYRSGRLVSFDLDIVSSNNEPLKTKEIWGPMGGYIGFNKFQPDSIKEYEHFVPMWCDITEPGNYTIQASKKFRFSWNKPDVYSKTKNIKIKHQLAKKAFTIVKDSVLFREFIDSLISEIKQETKGRVAEGIGFKQTNTSYISMSANLSKNLRKLDYINDERVVPFLKECYESNENIPQYKSIYNLTKFAFNKNAFQVLLNASQGESNSKCFVRPDSISITWTIEDMRQRALIGVLKASTKVSMNFLVSKRNDNFPEERFMLLLVAEKEFPFAKAKDLYLAYSVYILPALTP